MGARGRRSKTARGGWGSVSLRGVSLRGRGRSRSGVSGVLFWRDCRAVAQLNYSNLWPLGVTLNVNKSFPCVPLRRVLPTRWWLLISIPAFQILGKAERVIGRVTAYNCAGDSIAGTSPAHRTFSASAAFEIASWIEDIHKYTISFFLMYLELISSIPSNSPPHCLINLG